MEKMSPQPIRCRAAVCRAAGEALKIEEVVVAPPRAWEVRIKIICTSLCHSDLTIWRMKNFPAVYPRILGHEAVGIVESVGEHVDEVTVGDTVIPTFLANCTNCEDCRSDKSNMCSMGNFGINAGMPRDKTSRFTGASGEIVHHFLSVSSFSEYTVVDVANVVRVDAGVPSEKLCLLSCGVSTGVGAVWKVAGVEAGSTVAIFGLGAVGLAVAEGARLRGATKIIGVDLNPDKFDIGKKFGLTHFINPKEIGEKPICEGWGKTIILGVEMHGSPLSVSAPEILQGKCITGSLFGGIKAKRDIPVLIQKYLSKELSLDEFITHEVGFRDINKAFDLLIEGRSLRCTIWMDR